MHYFYTPAPWRRPATDRTMALPALIVPALIVPALIMPALIMLVGLSALLGCGGATPAQNDSAVTVEMMVAAVNPTLVSPNAANAAAAAKLYGSGCTWVTRSGDAAVCFFRRANGGKGAAFMAVYPTKSGYKTRIYTLYVAPAGTAIFASQPGLGRAQRWLDGHRIKRATLVDDAHAELRAELGEAPHEAIIGIEGKRWQAKLSGVAASGAPDGWPQARRDRDCTQTLTRVLVPPMALPVAFFTTRCRLEADGKPAFMGLPRLYALTPAKAEVKPPTAAELRKKAEFAALSRGPAETVKPAPARFTVEFTTTKGTFQIQITRAWAPHGVDRFYALVHAGFYRDIAFFRVIPGFMSQFGVHGEPSVARAWASAGIPDDRVNSAVASNLRGYLTFAKAGPNSRSTQLFINFRDNSSLDRMGFAPIGRVVGSGMNVVGQLYNGYGEGAPRGRGPDQSRVQTEGNTYLRATFPRLDYIKAIALVTN